MPPKAKPADVSQLLPILNRKNAFPWHASEMYLNTTYRLDRFLQVFKLPDVSVRDFDSALQLESENWRAGSKAIFESPIIKNCFSALIRPWASRAPNDTNYKDLIHYVINKKLPESVTSPLGTQEAPTNIHSLPNEVKLWLLSFLLDLRVNRDESETVDTYHFPDNLRVIELGEDSLGNSYRYFGDFRVFVELKKPQTYEHQIDQKTIDAADWGWLYEEFVQSAQFRCIAETREHWKHLIQVMNSCGKNEKAIGSKLNHLYGNELEYFNTELSRRARIHDEESRVAAKKEMEAMKELGLVRTSSRLQAKEIEQRRIMEEQRQREAEERARHIDSLSSGQQPTTSSDCAPKAMTREERRLFREAKIRAELEAKAAAEASPSTSGQNEDSTQYVNGTAHETAENEKDEEEEQVSETTAQPTEQTSSENPKDRPHVNGAVKSQSDAPTAIVPVKRKAEFGNDPIDKRRRIFEREPMYNRNHIDRQDNSTLLAHKSADKRDSYLHYKKSLERGELLIHPISCRKYYLIMNPSNDVVFDEEYIQQVQVAERFFYREFSKKLDSCRRKYGDMKCLDTFFEEVISCIIQVVTPEQECLKSRMHTVEVMDNFVSSEYMQGRYLEELTTECIELMRTAWTHLYPATCEEDTCANIILEQLRKHLRAI